MGIQIVSSVTYLSRKNRFTSRYKLIQGLMSIWLFKSYSFLIKGKFKDSLSEIQDDATSLANLLILSIYCARSVTEITPLASNRLKQ